MNIAFLTLSNINNINDRGIYSDLFRKFRDEGHEVYIVKPFERRTGRKTELFESDGVHILRVQTLNIQKTNIIEKGFGTVLLEGQYKRAIQRYLGKVRFDLILFSTPPITLVGAIKYLKRLNPQALTYLLLKDIFPQNAVDIAMMKEGGLLHRYFRHKEVQLYKASDYIGCMSPANVEFVKRHNPYINPDTVEVAPNSVELTSQRVSESTSQRASESASPRVAESASPRVSESASQRAFESTSPQDKESTGVLSKYGLPADRPILIYGGNLGKPQGIPFLMQCLEANKCRTDCHFVVVGTGTEFGRLKEWYDNARPQNMTLMAGLPKEDYDLLVRSCDAGLIFLDHRFLIPNFPSRLLSYLENRMPVIVATDPNCDMGPIAQANGFGYWCESNSVEAFTECVDKLLSSDIKAMGERGYRFLCDNYLVEHTYNAIMRHFDA